jgi:lipid A 3-O-deacylase
MTTGLFQLPVQNQVNCLYRASNRSSNPFVAPKPAGNIGGMLLAGTAVWLFIIGLFPCAVRAQSPSKAPLKTFSIYWENDSVMGTDQDYSNGLKLNWSRPYRNESDGRKGLRLRAWTFKHLPFLQGPDAQKATTFSLGQFIYTPKDTDRTDLIIDDRPYAGYTFLGFGFISVTPRIRHFWEFNLGVVGPWSLAENTQNGFHDLIRTRHAKGWDHQLDNEIGLEAVYELKWQAGTVMSSHGLGFDIIPHLGFQFGNIAISAKAGTELRFGWLLPRDFGNCPIRSACEAGIATDNWFGTSKPGAHNSLGFHFFAGVEGRAVLRNIFLDGNTFGSSHHVDKEIYVADLMGGIAMNYGRFKASYAMVLRTPEFKQRRDRHAFGTINVSFAY